MIHAFRLSHYDMGSLIPTPHEGPRTHCLAGPLEGHAVLLDGSAVPGCAMVVVYLPPGCAFDLDERREAIVEAVLSQHAKETMSASAPIPPHCDVPLCPVSDCSGPLITRAEHHRAAEYDPAHRLICLNCGEGRAGTDAEVEQAERARVAWEAKCAAML